MSGINSAVAAYYIPCTKEKPNLNSYYHPLEIESVEYQEFHKRAIIVKFSCSNGCGFTKQGSMKEI